MRSLTQIAVTIYRETYAQRLLLCMSLSLDAEQQLVMRKLFMRHKAQTATKSQSFSDCNRRSAMSVGFDALSMVLSPFDLPNKATGEVGNGVSICAQGQ